MTRRRPTPNPICPTCRGIQSGNIDVCPDCGKGLAFHLVSQTEIHDACEEIRAHWSRRRRRKEEGGSELEIPSVRRGGDGMRRREMEDGGAD